MSSSQHDSGGGGSGAGFVSDDTIFITGLPEDTNEEKLAKFFGQIGIIKFDKKNKCPKIWIYKDKSTGKGKGEATITYDDPPTATSAINWFNGKEFDGKVITVQLAERKTMPQFMSRGGGRGGSRGGGGGPHRHDGGGGGYRVYDRDRAGHGGGGGGGHRNFDRGGDRNERGYQDRGYRSDRRDRNDRFSAGGGSGGHHRGGSGGGGGSRYDGGQRSHDSGRDRSSDRGGDRGDRGGYRAYGHDNRGGGGGHRFDRERSNRMGFDRGGGGRE